MAEIIYDDGADLSLIQSKKVAIIGYGSQGHAHALNLKDSGVDVVVGLRPGSSSWAKAEAAGWRLRPWPRPSPRVTSFPCCCPTRSSATSTPSRLHPHLRKAPPSSSRTASTSATATSRSPRATTSSWSPPKGPGHKVRETYVQGKGTPDVVAVEVDASGKAWELALSYAKGIGGTRAGVIKTTFTEETETDLFGEQAVLCGSTSQLVQYGFEVLTEAGYQPEIAYFEVLHELKLIVDLMIEGGIAKQRWSISDTAEYGDYVSGPRVISPEVKKNMRLSWQTSRTATSQSASWKTRPQAHPSSRNCAQRARHTPSRQPAASCASCSPGTPLTTTTPRSVAR